jgi:hypothetical protein
MSVFDELKIDDPGKIFKPKKNLRSSSIIKKDMVNLNMDVRKINPYENNHIPQNKGKITPLTDDGDVIGFIYECSCGEIAKVIFDFEESFG